MSATPPDRIPELIAGPFDALPPGPLGVAVSGGSDSMALMALLAAWCGARGRDLHAITVDHGLRPESAAEARKVARAAAALGISHDIRRWDGWKGEGNLQDAARGARTRLIADWALDRGLAAVALGHTLDDQAETVVMRLARGSGVDGLSGMAAITTRDGVAWARPLLGVRRADLREWLRAQGIGWMEDPSNLDMRFDRVRVRAAMPELARIGLTPERLSETAAAMARARAALEADTLRLARAAATVQPIGTVTIDLALYAGVEAEIRLRLLAHALQWTAAARYRPRLASLAGLDDALVAALAEGFPRTLAGCLVEREEGLFRIVREPARTGPGVPAGALWDGRWRSASEEAGLEVRALGEAGLRLVSGAARDGHSRAALASSPAFWKDGALIAAPFANPSKACHVDLDGGTEGFFRAILKR